VWSPRQLDNPFLESDDADRRRAANIFKFSKKEIIMPDPVWLDTCALDNALKGNAAINRQLSEYRRAGRRLLIIQQSEIEMLYGNIYTLKKGKDYLKQVPSPEFREKMRTGLKKIGVEIDTKWREIPTPELDSWVSIGAENVSISDRKVLSQVRASAKARGIANPEILTAEIDTKAMANNNLTKKWGITSVQAYKLNSVDPEFPRVTLADYPEDKEGEVTKHFKDHAVWEKLSEESGEDKPLLKKLAPVAGEQPVAVRTQVAVVGVGIAAQAVSSAMMSGVIDHFTNAINLAKAEFDARHPDPVLLRAQAGLSPFMQAYQVALRTANRPSNLKKTEAVALAFTKDSDIPEAKEYLDAQIARVVSAKDGTLSSYRKVAREYIDAMVELDKKVVSVAFGVQDIAADIKKRGSVILSAGEALQTTFWKNLVITIQFPVVYYEWMNVKNTGDSLANLGSTVLAFSTYISDRLTAYQALVTQLQQEMQNVSDELTKFG
jgi:hypothetical protein